MHLKLTNGQPEKYSIGQLRRDNPNTSFPKNPPEALLADWDVYPYTTPEQPVFDSLTQTLSEGVFEQGEAGNWFLPWVVTNRPLDEAEAAIRRQRDRLLSDTDWIVIKAYERNQNIPAEWELYRQALRDITGQAGFPYDVTWPARP
jgi:hypothetical protein